MRILYAAPIAKRYNAMDTETRLAAEHGHDVHLAAHRWSHWDTHPLDPRVTVHWLRAERLRAPQSRLVTLALCRAPRAALRRLARGPLTGPAEAVLGAWDRAVAGRVEDRRRRRTNELRHAFRREAVLALIETEDIEWLVLGEPGAIDLLADDIEDLLERRPGLRTTYSYEEFAEDAGAA